jgi:hypothetical protein
VVAGWDAATPSTPAGGSVCAAEGELGCRGDAGGRTCEMELFHGGCRTIS